MNIRKIISVVFIAGAALVLLFGCSVKYSFTGASIHPAAQTVSVAYFPNNATMVAPILSATFTDALKEKFARQTRLTVLSEGGDLSFEGEITNYTSTPAAVSGDEYAVMNRLTIMVMVRFVNNLEPQYNFSRSFTAFTDYDSNRLLTEVENQLIDEIVEILVDDIFNAAVSNW